MQLKSQTHHDLMAFFESKVIKTLPCSYRRLDREDKGMWDKGRIYKNGEVNALFLAFRLGYSLCISELQ